MNEYAYDFGDKDLKGLIVQVTGLENENRVVDLIQSTFKKLKAVADFEAPAAPAEPAAATDLPAGAIAGRAGGEFGFNISYTINLNLPATTNVEVFNAIFKSLKENLLRGG